MALKKCKECGGMVSSKAKSCPQCGATVKNGVNGCAGMILVIFLACAFMVTCTAVMAPSSDSKQKSPNSSESESTASPEAARKELIKKQFSAWDGSHPALTRIIKKSMNDPKSYDHVETGYWDQGDHLIVKTTFRGKNAFGGVVVNWVKAKVDLKGNVIELLEQGP